MQRAGMILGWLGMALVAQAQTPQVFATGLSNPSKLILGPAGSLLATSVKATPNSGQVALISATGATSVLIDGLPSGSGAPDFTPDGPNGLALNGRTLYVSNGEGDSHINGPQPGQIVPNPKGPSSPLFASILSFTFSKDINQISSGFVLTGPQQNTLADGTAVTLTNSSGDTAAVQLVTAFRLDRPDPVTIYRNSHPYGLLLASGGTQLYVVDAGMNTLESVDVNTGHTTLITRFANRPSPLPAGPPVVEAVPTSVTAYGNQLLVSQLSGAPFVPGFSQVVSVDPATGNTSPFIAALSSAIDIKFRLRQDGTGQWFTLEFSSALAQTPPGAGRVRMYTSPAGQVIADGLLTPTSMALDAVNGFLYVTTLADGNVLKINVGQ